MAKLTDMPPELLIRIFAQIPFEARVAATGTCRATAQLLREPTLWQAAVFQRRRGISNDAWTSALSLQRWIRRHGSTLQQLQLSRLPLAMEHPNEFNDFQRVPDLAAAGLLLGNVVAVAPLTAMRIDGAASEHLSRPVFNCIAMLGPTLRHLVLLDIRLVCALALEQAVRSLPNLQGLAVRFTMYGSPDHQYRLQAHAPDVLGVACAAAASCPSLRLLCLSADRECMQEHVRDSRGHSSLAALSQLARLSCLQLAGAAIRQWPSQLSRLTSLQQLAVVDSMGQRQMPANAEPLPWPVPHELQLLPSLQRLRSGILSWQQPLPGSLTQLVLDCCSRRDTWQDMQQWRPLLQQLPSLTQLATLVLVGATWEPPQMQLLADALQRCCRLRELQLLGFRNCVAQLLPDLGKLTHLHALAVVGGGANAGSRDDGCSAMRQLRQLTACRRLHWSQGSPWDVQLAAPAFAAMPALEQLTLVGHACPPDAIWRAMINQQRGLEGLPAVQVAKGAVPSLWEPAVEVPFEECNIVLGQQLDQLVV